MSCPDCFKGSVHDHAEPTGHFEILYGWKTYITGDANAKSAILYLPDAFGLRLVNNKILAGNLSFILIYYPILTWFGALRYAFRYFNPQICFKAQLSFTRNY